MEKVGLVILGAASVLVACSGTRTPGAPSPGPAASAVSAAAPSAEATFPVPAELAAVRLATAQFHDVANAYAANYTTQFEPCVAIPGVGVMGVHAPNAALIQDQEIDPLRPEALLYVPRPNGGLRLTGVEYVQIVLVRNPATGEVAPWISPDPWPSNYEVVTPTPRLFGQTFEGPMPGHIPSMPWHWDLHVWIWAHNPSGLFAEWNPSLRCE